jgi:5'-nucleotidase
MKKRLYVDLDNVLVDFQSGIERISEADAAKHADALDEVPGIFGLMDPLPGAVAAYSELAERFDSYVLSTAPWENSTAWSDKLLWVQQHLGESAYKRLILTHHKNLISGDFLVDDRPNNGADQFEGELILFGTDPFPDWPSVLEYLRAR